MFDSFLFTFVLYGIHVLSMLFVFMYVHCCPWRITSDDIRACRLAVTRRVSLVEQELFTILVHLSCPPSYSGVLAAQSLVFSLVLVEQELLTILVHLSSPPSYSGDLAAQSLVFSLVLVEQELLTILVHLSSPPSYSGVLAAQCLVFSLVLVEQIRSCLPFWCTWVPPSYSGVLAAQCLVFFLLVEQVRSCLPFWCTWVPSVLWWVSCCSNISFLSSTLSKILCHFILFL